MADSFDPYYIWLGIPPEEQPADHYRLLGIKRFEPNPEVITNAADQRVRHLRSMQTGKRQAETQKLLNEISALTGVLLDPDKKKDYDGQLKAKLAAAQPKTAPAAPLQPAQHGGNGARHPVAHLLPVAPVLPVAAHLPTASHAPRVPLPAPMPRPAPSTALPPAHTPAPVINLDVGEKGPRVEMAPPAKTHPLFKWLAIGGGVAGVAAVALVGILLHLGVVGPDKSKTVHTNPQKTTPAVVTSNEGSGLKGSDSDKTNTTVAKSGKDPNPNSAVAPVAPFKVKEPGVTPVVTADPREGAPAWLKAYYSVAQPTTRLLRDVPLRNASHSEMKITTPGALRIAFDPNNTEGWHGVSFDFSPPADYSLTVVVSQAAGEDGLAIDFPVAGRMARVVVDETRDMNGTTSFFSGLDVVAGDHAHTRSDSKAWREQPLLGRVPRTVQISVVGDRVCASIIHQGKFNYFCNYESEPARLGISSGYSGFGDGRIGVSTRAKHNLHDVKVTPLVPKDLIAKSPGDATSVSSPLPKPVNLKVDKPIDVFSESSRKDLVEAELDGRTLTTHVDQVSTATFDSAPRSDYVLAATVTRTAGDDGILFGIVVDGRPCSVGIDCFVREGKGAHSGLELIAGQRLISPGYPAVHKGPLLKNGQPAKVEIVVRKGNVILQVDGKVVVNWKGDPALLSRVPVTLSAAGSNLAIGTWHSAYTVENLKIYPILGDGSTQVASTDPGTKTEPMPMPGNPSTQPPTPPVPVKKDPIPDDAAITQARLKLKESFGDYLAKTKKADEKLSLGKEFVSVAATEKDPTIRYSLLDAARRLGMAGHDIKFAMEACDQIEKQFEADGLTLRLETLKFAGSGGVIVPTDVWESIAEMAADLAYVGLDSRRLEIAEPASQAAVDAAARGKNSELKKGVKVLRDHVTALRKLSDQGQQALGKLETMPDDPAANLAAGKWFCFGLGDWAKGAAYLAKCGEPALVAAATGEAKDEPLAKADGWSEAIAALQGDEKLTVQRRALFYYEQASTSLQGLDQLRAARRVTELKDAIATLEKTAPKRVTASGSTAKKSALKPGLMVRVFIGQQPTHILGTIKSFQDFRSAARGPIRDALGFTSSSYQMMGAGYIQLDKDEDVVFQITNATCIVDGAKLAGSDTEQFVTLEKKLAKGKHSILITPYNPSNRTDSEFYIYKKSDSQSCLFFSPADLEAELAKPIRAVNGQTLQGQFLFGER